MKKTLVKGGISKGYKSIAGEIITKDMSAKSAGAYIREMWERSGLDVSLRSYASRIYTELMYLSI